MNKESDDLLDKLYAFDKTLMPSNCIVSSPPVATDSPGLNYILNGGVRQGGMYIITGPEGCGKSFLTMSWVANLLRQDPQNVVIWFDVEKSFNPHFANILFTPEEFRRCIVKRVDFGSEIFDYFENTLLGNIEKGMKIAACVVDSVQAIIPPKEANSKSVEDHTMGDLSSMLPKALRKILTGSRPRLRDNFLGVAWFFISQVRLNLDPTAVYTGEKYKITGGSSFLHSVDVILELDQIKSKKAKIFDESQSNMNDTAVQIGNRVRAKVKKNRYGPPFRVSEFDLSYDYGIVNQHQEIFTLGYNLGIIKKEGNTYSLNDQKIAVGEANTAETIKSNQDLYKQIEKEIIKESTNEFSKPITE